MKKYLLAVLCLSLLAQSCLKKKNPFSNTPLPHRQNLSAAVLWKLGRVSDPRISPDGKWVLFGVKTANIAANKTHNIIYKMEISGGTPVAITDSLDNANSAVWRPDRQKIGYMSSKGGEMQFWEMNTDGTHKRQMTHLEEGIDLFEYAPDMKHILYAADVQVDPTNEQRYPDLPCEKSKGRIYDELNIRHWDTWNEGKYTHLFFVNYTADGINEKDATDILKNEPFDSPLKPFGGSEQISWTPDGSSIAYTCKKMRGTQYMNSTNSDIYLHNIQTGQEQDLTEANKGYDQSPAFSPDGKYMTWLSMEHDGYESDKNRLMLMDMNSKQITDLSAGFDQVTDMATWGSDNKTIYFISETNATKQLYTYHIGAGAGHEIEQITNGQQDYNELAVGKDGDKNVIVGSQTTMTHPAELYTIDASSKKETQLDFANKYLLDSINTSRVQKRWVKASDGKNILTWVIFPPNFDSTKKYPILLYCQGGPQDAVSQFFSIRWNFALMAAHGYIVVAPNRRGLPSFGQEWNDEIAGDYGGQCMRDYNSAIDAVAQEPYVDRNKIGCVGASFGGYSVYYLAGHNLDKKFKVFIAHDGIFDFTSMYGSTEEMWFINHDMKGPYWKNREDNDYKKFSPHQFIENWNTPIMIVSNELDYRVPFTQGLEAFTAAQEMGIPSRLLTFPDENHWVLKPQNSLLWHRAFYDWLDKYLK